MPNLITIPRARLSGVLAEVAEGLLTALVAAASGAVELLCGREFTLESRVETYDGDGQSSMLLDQYPVDSITTVIIIEDDGTEVEIASTQFRLRPNIGELKFKPDCDADYCYFPSGFQNIKTTYEAGFDTIPELIQQACVFTVQDLYSDNERDLAMKSENMGDYSYTIADLQRRTIVPPAAQALLAKYRDYRA